MTQGIILLWQQTGREELTARQTNFAMKSSVKVYLLSKKYKRVAFQAEQGF